jgi:hypothetical protein
MKNFIKQSTSWRKEFMMNPESGDEASRMELVQRIRLMESMVEEGRLYTAQCGWIFVLWGIVGLVAVGWQYLQPDSRWVGMWGWPVCLLAGAVLTGIGRAFQKRESPCGGGTRSRSVEAVWGMMGVALAIYISSAMVRHLGWQYSFTAAILIMVGMAHAISAAILRWRVQGLVACIWWAGAVATFFARSQSDVELVLLLEMGLGMALFGLYAMMMERRSCGEVNKNG